MLSLSTRRGRGTPLIRVTVENATLKESRNAHYDRVLWRLHEVLPEGVFYWVATDELAVERCASTFFPRIENKSLAYLQYTSGSTSAPKGVMVSHSGLLHTLLDLDRGGVHDSNSVMVTWLPLYHDMGLIYGMLQPQDIEATVERCHPALRLGGGAAFAVEADGEERVAVAQELERTWLRRANTDEVIEAICTAVAREHDLTLLAVALLRPASVPAAAPGRTGL